MLTEGEWSAAAAELVETYRANARSFVREAFLGFFTRGSAAVPASAMELLLDRLDARTGEVFAIAHLQALPKDDASLDAAWTRMYGEFRDAIRAEVARTLTEAGIAREEHNAVAFALEREFTIYDHSLDLADEVFEVSVTLPGELVTGNFADQEPFEPTARWKVEGHQLLLGDVTLRAVSVVE